MMGVVPGGRVEDEGRGVGEGVRRGAESCEGSRRGETHGCGVRLLSFLIEASTWIAGDGSDGVF